MCTVNIGGDSSELSPTWFLGNIVLACNKSKYSCLLKTLKTLQVIVRSLGCQQATVKSDEEGELHIGDGLSPYFFPNRSCP